MEGSKESQNSAVPTPPLEPFVPQPTVASLQGSVVSGGGSYKLLKRLGAGGFGEVWRAQAPGGVEVAIKIVFHPIEDAQAQRELEALELIKFLRHPFLLQTQGFWLLNNKLHIAMELADGSLRDRQKECRREGLPGIPLRELLTYFREAAEALDYLHRQHVLHRDVKPDNILLLQRHAKVADFGLARLHEADTDVSATGCGTPAYMAPEVWRRHVSERSDQYSLALTYAELRLNRPVLGSRDMMEMMIQHLEKPPDLSPLSAGEQLVLRQALAKDPTLRFDRCAAFVEALERELATELTGTMGSVVANGFGTDTAASAASESVLRAMPTRAVGGGKVTGPTQPPRVGPEPSATAVLPYLPPLPKRRHSRKAIVVIVGLALVILASVGGWKLWKGVPSNLVTNSGMEARSGDAPSSQVDALPENCQPTTGAELRIVNGKRYASQIDYRLPDETQVRFVLIAKDAGTDPDTFYIQRDKVSVGLFRQFARTVVARGQNLQSDKWEKEGAVAAGKPLRAENELLPVMNVSVYDAWQCARWLGGKLPTFNQWNKAAGLFETNRSGEGPFVAPWGANDIAVNRPRQGPMEVGTAAKDVSPLGCRDMAGNGQEWTRELAADLRNRTLPLDKADQFDRVLLRGRSYAAPSPLLYIDMENSQKTVTEAYLNTSPYTGFRVVLEP